MHHQIMIEYAEEIHFLRGENTEVEIIKESFDELNSTMQKMSINLCVSSFFNNYIVRYMGIMASFISLLPMIKNHSNPTEFLLNNLHDLVNVGLALRNLFAAGFVFSFFFFFFCIFFVPFYKQCYKLNIAKHKF